MPADIPTPPTSHNSPRTHVRSAPSSHPCPLKRCTRWLPIPELRARSRPALPASRPAGRSGPGPVVAGRGPAGLTRARLRKPLIAAVEGAAVAGGFELALACDLITAADTAFFALPEVARGLIAAEGRAIRLPGRLPCHVAMEMLLTAAPLSATDAARYGLVNRLTPEGRALEAALDLSARIQAHSPHAVHITKQIVQNTRGLDDHAAYGVQDPLSTPVFATTAATEGAQAFTRKRSPAWDGAPASRRL